MAVSESGTKQSVEYIPIIQAVLCFVSDELTRLWNLNQDNMEACKSDNRSVDQKAKVPFLYISEKF